MPSSTPKSFFQRSFGSCSDLLTCRQVLNIMVMVGFMFNYMLRANITITIVKMVVSPSNNTNITSNATDINSENLLDGTRYEWDEYVQNLILGSFYWGYICTELPGGRLAELFGARRVFGYSMLLASIVTLLTPIACTLGSVAVIILRIIVGFLLGATWPAIPPMTAQWIPPMERSKFMANMMASALGAAITVFVSGFIIASWGWESVFYVTGVVGIAWCVLWFALIYDSPAQHPRISPEERAYIEDAIGSTSSKGKAHEVPWRSLLSSLPVWAIIITHGCSVFGYFTIVNQLPTFCKKILHFEIKGNGFVSSLPYLGKYLFAVCTSYLADFLRRSERLSTTATRKIFTTFAVITPGLLMMVQVFEGQDRIAAISIFTLALTINGAVTAGYLSNALDIAPNFSGTIFGMANTLSSAGGFLSSFMVGVLTKGKEDDFAPWQLIFWILMGLYVFGGLVFLVFGTGELQPWNSPQKCIESQEHANGIDESIPLKNGVRNGKT